jgi:hypothetical protein
MINKTMMESQERSGCVLRKPYAPAFGFKNTHLLPQRGKKCSVSGFALLSRLERNHARSAFSLHRIGGLVLCWNFDLGFI